MDEQAQGSVVKVMPLTWVLVAVAVAAIGLSVLIARSQGREVAAHQAAIEKMVEDTRAFCDKMEGIKERNRRLIDPLVMLAEIDKELEARGLPPASARDYSRTLAEENRKLLTSPDLAKYIDTCRQMAEVEKHMLFEGIHTPIRSIRAFPGWSADWKTRCKSILDRP